MRPTHYGEVSSWVEWLVNFVELRQDEVRRIRSQIDDVLGE